jgi:hypothetical protein
VASAPRRPLTLAAEQRARDPAAAAQLELDGLEWFGGDDRRVLPHGQDRPHAFAQAQHLECAVLWLHEPCVCDARLRVDSALAPAVEPLGRRREHGAHPIRSEREEGFVWHGWQPFTRPPGEVRNQDLLSEMQLRLVEDPPATGASDAPMEGIPDGHPDLRRRHGAPRLRP